MQTWGAKTTTLLEAQDIHLAANFRRLPAEPRRERPATPRGASHDFLVLSQRPDLTPEFFPAAAPTAVQSWERNMPQK